jgi:hypothetical protein
VHLSVKAAEAGVDAGDDKTCICNGVALQHKGYGGGVLVAGNMDADTVVIEAAVANDHVAELTAGSFMSAHGHAFLNLGYFIAKIDRACGQKLQSLTDNLYTLVAFQRTDYNSCKHVAVRMNGNIKFKIIVG